MFHIFSDTGLKRWQVILISPSVLWPDAWHCPGKWAGKLDFSEMWVLRWTQHYRKILSTIKIDLCFRVWKGYKNGDDEIQDPKETHVRSEVLGAQVSYCDSTCGCV